jgi:hypothetical protein
VARGSLNLAINDSSPSLTGFPMLPIAIFAPVIGLCAAAETIASVLMQPRSRVDRPAGLSNLRRHLHRQLGERYGCGSLL